MYEAMISLIYTQTGPLMVYLYTKINNYHRKISLVLVNLIVHPLLAN